MKKLASLMLGLSLVAGTALFAQDSGKMDQSQSGDSGKMSNSGGKMKKRKHKKGASADKMDSGKMDSTTGSGSSTGSTQPK